ncbi:MAG: hypothetical protein M3Y22_04470 [Pseudomonadota bacterium]|nr:hypothetical protein [Pseudomonadota bacterium]
MLSAAAPPVPATTLTFEETMCGGFSLGETDPAAGRARGAAAGTDLVLHASVSIEDLDHFVTDPDHTGLLSGSIDFPPLGMGLQGASGVFNLFEPGDQPGLKLMIYEVGFAQAGRPYYLAGRKLVRRHPLLDLWHDTTTLYATLHAGGGPGGSVLGAGILTLDLEALLRMLETFRVEHAPSAAARAETLARFGRFFLGELWDIYALHAGVGESA